MVFDGPCNTELFDAWVENFLIKELTANQVVIMDNASFHRSKKTQTLIESAGCRVIFPPPYSPDLNPIEKFWARMKDWIRRQIGNFGNLFNALSPFFCVQNAFGMSIATLIIVSLCLLMLRRINKKLGK